MNKTLSYQNYLKSLGSLFIILNLSQTSLAQTVKHQLFVFTVPADATVSLSNEPKFEQGIWLEPGLYEVQIKKPGYIAYRKWITINNQNKDIIVKLLPNQYKLYIDTTPEHANIKMLGNKKFKQGIALKPGKYQIEVSSLGYKTTIKSVNINNQDVHLGIDLEPKKEMVPAGSYALSINTQDNQITIKNLQPGKYEIKISKSGYKTKRLPIEITNQDEAINVNLLVLSDGTTCSLSSEDSDNITVSINGHSLRFIKIAHGMIDDIALREATASNFHEMAKRMLEPNTAPLYPFIFRAVSEQPMPKVVPTFWIQEKPISSELYEKMIPDNSADSVSYNHAMRAIETLNLWCGAKFALPSEKQFIYLARQIYNPVTQKKLKPCSELKNLETSSGVKQLLGNQWQLTQSKCVSYSTSSDTTRKCEIGTYIKKGGSTESRDATECMPEYRAESAPDIKEPNTTFRLVLIPE